MTGRAYGQVKVSTDKGYLRLQFSSILSRAFYNKRQYFKALGRRDTPLNRKWAEAIASRIQADIDHPDILFDKSLEKYLAVCDLGVSANDRSLKLGELWQEFVEYKYKIGKISITTYQRHYKRTFTNWLLPYFSENLSHDLAERLVIDLLEKQVNRINARKLISALKEACDRAIQQEKIGQNFFAGLAENIKLIKKSSQLQEEEDYKAFSQEERNIIVQAFYLSDRKSERQIADLVSFLFLTGCRLGEVFALKFDDLKPDRIIFDESYSSETGILKTTKTNTIRIFKIQGYTKLQNLIKALKAKALPNQEYVFVTQSGKQYNRSKLSALWIGVQKNKEYYCDGLVTRLVKEGKISQYLKPSSTRHTFITLQAHAGVDLKLLADSVGNSVDVIYNHYLGVNKDAAFKDI